MTTEHQGSQEAYKRFRFAMVSAIYPESHSASYLLTELQDIDEIAILAEDLPDGIHTDYKNVQEAWKRGGPFVWSIFSRLRNMRARVAHLQHEFNLYGGIKGVVGFPLLLLLLRIFGIKVLVSIHGVYPTRVINDQWCRTFGLKTFPGSLAMYRIAFAMFYRAVLALSNAVHVNAEIAKRDLIEAYGGKTSRIHVIVLGIPRPERTPAADPATAWSPLVNQRTLLCFGYILPRKGLEVMLDAFEEIKAQVPDARLCIAGEDLPTHVKYATDLRAHIQQRFRRDDIIVTGPISHAEMLWIFQHIGVAVFPYTTPVGSSGPLTIAIQAARPVVATNFEIFAEVIEPFGYGKLVPPGDYKSLSEACVEILKSDDLWRDMSRRATVASEEMSWRNIALQLDELYKSLDTAV